MFCWKTADQCYSGAHVKGICFDQSSFQIYHIDNFHLFSKHLSLIEGFFPICGQWLLRSFKMIHTKNMGQKVKILDALIWMRKKLIIPFQSFGMELAQWREESEDGRTAGVELERKDQIWMDCWTWCWTRENKTKDGRTAGVEGGDGGDQPGRTRLRPQRLHCGGVLRGGGHFSSFLLWVVQHDFPRLVISKMPRAWTLPKRSSLTMSQVRSRMRWVFDNLKLRQNQES